MDGKVLGSVIGSVLLFVVLYFAGIMLFFLGLAIAGFIIAVLTLGTKADKNPMEDLTVFSNESMNQRIQEQVKTSDLTGEYNDSTELQESLNKLQERIDMLVDNGWPRTWAIATATCPLKTGGLPFEALTMEQFQGLDQAVKWDLIGLQWNQELHSDPETLTLQAVLSMSTPSMWDQDRKPKWAMAGSRIRYEAKGSCYVSRNMAAAIAVMANSWLPENVQLDMYDKAIGYQTHREQEMRLEAWLNS